MAGLRVQGRRSALSALALLFALQPSGTGFDPYCRDLLGEPCEEHGIANEVRAAICDDCGTAWSCDDDGLIINVGFPCSCIDDEGILQYGLGEQGYPPECRYSE